MTEVFKASDAPKDLYYHEFKAELAVLLQERINAVHTDTIWLSAMLAFNRGITAHTAANELFREILAIDLGNPQTG